MKAYVLQLNIKDIPTVCCTWLLDYCYFFKVFFFTDFWVALWMFTSTLGCQSRMLQSGGMAVGEGTPRFSVYVVCVHLGVCLCVQVWCVCIRCVWGAGSKGGDQWLGWGTAEVPCESVARAHLLNIQASSLWLYIPVKPYKFILYFSCDL